jgi:hypothetical protein
MMPLIAEGDRVFGYFFIVGVVLAFLSGILKGRRDG